MPPPPTTPRWPAPLSGLSAWSLLLSRSSVPASPFAYCGEPFAQRRTPPSRATTTPPGPLVNHLDGGYRTLAEIQQQREALAPLLGPAAAGRPTRTGGLSSAHCPPMDAPMLGQRSGWSTARLIITAVIIEGAPSARRRRPAVRLAVHDSRQNERGAVIWSA